MDTRPGMLHDRRQVQRRRPDRPRRHHPTSRSSVAAASQPPASAPSPSTSPPPTRPPAATSPSGPPAQARPTASNLNFVAGQTVPNMVIVPVGANGQISLYNNTGTVDVIVDVLGWFPTGDSYTGLTPARLMDTRPGTHHDRRPVRRHRPDRPDRHHPTSLSSVAAVSRPPVSALSHSTSPPPTRPPAASSPSGPPAQARPNASNLNFAPARPCPTWSSSPSAPTGRSRSTTTPAPSTSSSTSSAGSPPDPIHRPHPRPPDGHPHPSGASPTSTSPGTGRIDLLGWNAPRERLDPRPGRYFAVNAKSGCYWERLRGLGGTSGGDHRERLSGFRRTGHRGHSIDGRGIQVRLGLRAVQICSAAGIPRNDDRARVACRGLERPERHLHARPPRRVATGNGRAVSTGSRPRSSQMTSYRVPGCST